MSAGFVDDILNEVVTGVKALAFILNGVVVPVVKRKLPKKEEQVDPAVQFTVCKSDRPDEVRFIAFGGPVKVKRLIEVVLISPNNNDMLTNLGLFAAWMDLIRTKFQKAPLGNLATSGVPAVMDLDIVPEVFLDRGQLLANYDYAAMGIRVTSVESQS